MTHVVRPNRQIDFLIRDFESLIGKLAVFPGKADALECGEKEH